MSVINQMLRDLDARGQGDAASRRAAMASVGHPAGHPVSSWRSRRLWWLAAALSVALAAVAVLLVANRWEAIDRLAEVPVDAPAVTPTVAAPAPAPVPATEITAAESRSPAAPNDVSPPAPQPAPASPAPEPSASIDPAPRPDALPPPEPTPQPAPAARATIERVAAEVDPLDAARVALAEGRADAALAALAAQPEAGAERDALEAAALQQLGRHAEAEQAYRRALQREPDIGAWWAGLGIALDASGRGDEALAAFREAQRRGPLDPALADYLGERVEALSAGEPSR